MSRTQALWERPGSVAEQFWRHGRADFPIYDMHGHMGAHNAIYFARCEAPAMDAHLARIGVRRLVFSHHSALMGSMRNAAVHRIVEGCSERLRMYVAINPHYPEFIKEDLALFDKWPFAIGLKMLSAYHQVAVTDRRYEYALKFASERHLPVLNHTWGGVPYCGGPQLLELSQRYPNVIFFHGHSIFGDWDWSRRCIVEAPGNCYLELTAVPGLRGIIERLVHDVGSERIIYGTDLPWFDEYQVTGGVISADIGDDDIKNILYRNVERVLGTDW